MVGRACLGRPWLIQQVQAAMKGEKPRGEPNLQEAVDAACDHLQRLVAYWDCETTAVRHAPSCLLKLNIMGTTLRPAHAALQPHFPCPQPITTACPFLFSSAIFYSRPISFALGNGHAFPTFACGWPLPPFCSPTVTSSPVSSPYPWVCRACGALRN